MILDFILSFNGMVSRAEDWHDVSHITQLRSGKSVVRLSKQRLKVMGIEPGESHSPNIKHPFEIN